MGTYRYARFDHIDDLQEGNKRQQAAYRVLQDSGIMQQLHPYHPVLVGTIPIDLAIEASDLDILCEVYDMEGFIHHLEPWLMAASPYKIEQGVMREVPYVCISFNRSEFDVEVFGQPLPVTMQNGYRHMMVEARLLDQGGIGFMLSLRG